MEEIKKGESKKSTELKQKTNPPYALLYIGLERMNDFSYESIRKYIMENNYDNWLKDALSEVEFISNWICKESYSFIVKMKHPLFSTVNEAGRDIHGNPIKRSSNKQISGYGNGGTSWNLIRKI